MEPPPPRPPNTSAAVTNRWPVDQWWSVGSERLVPAALESGTGNRKRTQVTKRQCC